VALFVSNEAFTDPGLQGQAKMGALLSIGSAGFSWLLSAAHGRCGAKSSDEASDAVTALGGGEDGDLVEEEEDDGFEDVITHELMEKMWEFRRYKARGHHMNIEQMARSVTRKVSQVSRVTTISSAHDEDNITRSTSLTRIGRSPSTPDMARSNKKHATWATTHLR